MAVYSWKGLKNNELTQGQLEAGDESAARARLQAIGVIVTHIETGEGVEDVVSIGGKDKKKKKVSLRGKITKGKKVKIRDLVVFTKQLSTMVAAGLPILKILKMLEQQKKNENFQWVVNNVRKNVEGGVALSEAMALHGSVFDPVYVNLVRAGETSGKLSTFLERLVVQLEKAERIRSKVKSALMYPTILLSVAVTVIAIMLIKVVPVFEKMFGALQQSLPLPTEIVISISEFLRDPLGGGVLLAAIVVTVLGVPYQKRRSEKFRRKLDSLALRIPVLGQVMINSNLSRIAMVKGNLLAAGVSMIESIEIAIDSLTNTVFTDALERVKKGVSAGQSLSSLYEKEEIFPVTFCQMVAVGEETGNMEEMLESTANYYEEAFDITVTRLMELLEPIMIIFMGLTVGFIIVAMYMPIFKIGEIVGG